MQTFLPYPDFKQSLICLDVKRLGKQRVEAMQMVNAIENVPTKSGRLYRGWHNHPCTRMWRPYVMALKLYTNTAIETWVERGYRNSMVPYTINYDELVMPHWLGDDAFHRSHQSNLYHKLPSHYPQFEMEFIPYVWNEDS
jgi:hypothetical protein